jgi:hypothetical protein
MRSAAHAFNNALTIEMGTTLEETDFSTTAIPPTADVTETAGVNTPIEQVSQLGQVVK